MDSGSQYVAEHLFSGILQSGQFGSSFLSSMLTNAAKNRQHLFDNDVLHSFLTKIDNWDDTERLLFSLFLVNQYGARVQFRQSDCDIEINRISTE